MARTRATAPGAGTTQQMKTPPASEDANGVFHAFTSLKVAALEMKTSKQRLRSGWIRIFCSSACASRPECRPSLAQRCRIIFMALPFEFLLRFLETCHACCDFGSLAREPVFRFRHHPSRSCLARVRLIRVRHDWRAQMGRELGNDVAGLWSRALGKQWRWIKRGALLSLQQGAGRQGGLTARMMRRRAR